MKLNKKYKLSKNSYVSYTLEDYKQAVEDLYDNIMLYFNTNTRELSERLIYKFIEKYRIKYVEDRYGSCYTLFKNPYLRHFSGINKPDIYFYPTYNTRKESLLIINIDDLNPYKHIPGSVQSRSYYYFGTKYDYPTKFNIEYHRYAYEIKILHTCVNFLESLKNHLNE